MRALPEGDDVSLGVLKENREAKQRLPGVISERTIVSTNADFMRFGADP
jgi:hypothetical protein